MAVPQNSADAGDALPLAGMRVLEVGRGIAGAFAGKWLAALGAEVLALEARVGDAPRPAGPPGDRPDAPEASARRIYLNTAKRCAFLDLEDPAGCARAEALACESDVLIDTGGRLDSSALRARAPALVIVRVTPFGTEGPYADQPATSLTVAALCGMLWHVGEAGRPPLAQPGEQPEYLAGLHVLGAALTGYWGALETGRGALYDLTLQTVGASAMGHYTARESQTGEVQGRSEPRALWRLYEAADGWVGICALARNYAQLASVMELPELAGVSPFLDDRDAEERRRITRTLVDWFRQRPRREIYELARQQRVPLGIVMSLGELIDSEQLRHRDFFADEEHPTAGTLRYPGQLWVGSGHGWLRRRAPRPGADAPRFDSRPARRGVRDDARVLPLEGLRVIELGQIWAGPYAAMLLADQGADVIKVESPRAWDPNRCAAPPPAGREKDWWNTSAYFHEYNRNKRAISLDLHDERGRRLFARLVRSADALIENFRADTLDRLGIGYEWLCEQNPGIVLVSMAGFGKTGPERHMPGYGPIIEQTSGIAGLTGYGDGRPQIVQYAYGDPVAAVAAASATLAALLQRRRTGRGQHLDVAQRDVTTALLGEAFVERCIDAAGPPVYGNQHPCMAPHGVYACAGVDDWVAIAVSNDAQWEGLRAAMGEPAWAREPLLASARGRLLRRDELDARLAEWTRGLGKRDVFERCRERGVPAGPVWDDAELVADTQLLWRRFHETASHPAMGEWLTHGWDWRPEGTGACVRRPAPGFAQHNPEVFGGELGLSDARLAALEADGVIASEPVGVPPLRPIT